jgi:hypothetical protein
MIRNDQKSDVPCGTMSPMHLYILAGTQFRLFLFQFLIFTFLKSHVC